MLHTGWGKQVTNPARYQNRDVMGKMYFPGYSAEAAEWLVRERDIRFFTDESKTTELLRIKARQRFDPRATYDITGADGSKIGEIKKVFGASLIRSTYEISSPAVTVRATESNLVVALFRRLVGLVPYIGDFADWLPIPYHFDFTHDGEVLGRNKRRFGTFRDIYDIDFSGDPGRRFDRP